MQESQFFVLKQNTSDPSYTANDYRQTTDKPMFKSIISTVRMNQNIGYGKMCYQQAEHIDIQSEVCALSKECTQ